MTLATATPSAHKTKAALSSHRLRLPSAAPSHRLPLPSAAPASEAIPHAAIQASVSSARPMRTVLFEARDARGISALVALVDRRSGALAFIAESKGLDSAEVDTLRALAKGNGALTPTTLEDARLHLLRAILATRIAGGDLPAWLAERFAINDATMTRIDDVYRCVACDASLPMAAQVERAEARGIGDTRCPACRRGKHVPEPEHEVWLLRGRLMLAAGLTRRALVCAARAEGMRASPERVDDLRHRIAATI